MTVASGILSLPLVALRTIIATTPAFQGFVSAANPVAAAASLHLIETPRQTAARFGLVDFGEMIRDRQALGLAPFAHRDGSTLTGYFRGEATSADDESAMLDFANTIGAIWAQIEISAGAYDKRTLAIKSIELLIAPTRIVHEKRERAGDYFEAALGFTYTRQP